MPQADHVLTVVLDTPPQGFLSEVSTIIPGDKMDNAHIRLEMLIDTFFIVRQTDEIGRLSTMSQNALAMIETGLRDVSDLLNAVPRA